MHHQFPNFQNQKNEEEIIFLVSHIDRVFYCNSARSFKTSREFRDSASGKYSGTKCIQ